MNIMTSLSSWKKIQISKTWKWKKICDNWEINMNHLLFKVIEYSPVTSHVVPGKTIPALGRTQYFFGLVVLTYSITSSKQYALWIHSLNVQTKSINNCNGKTKKLPWTPHIYLFCWSIARNMSSASSLQLFHHKKRNPKIK